MLKSSRNQLPSRLVWKFALQNTHLHVYGSKFEIMGINPKTITFISLPNNTLRERSTCSRSRSTKIHSLQLTLHECSLQPAIAIQKLHRPTRIWSPFCDHENRAPDHLLPASLLCVHDAQVINMKSKLPRSSWTRPQCREREEENLAQLKQSWSNLRNPKKDVTPEILCNLQKSPGDPKLTRPTLNPL